MYQLSVSSVGSEAMQRGEDGFGLAGRDSTFSILGRIGGDATFYPLSLERAYIAFSILGRIGGDATPPRRRMCRKSGGSLSVSSVGSEAMQPAPASKCVRATRTFQYPRSDRRRCNFKIATLIPAPHSVLSVSSVGSEAMQQWKVFPP